MSPGGNKLDRLRAEFSGEALAFNVFRYGVRRDRWPSAWFIAIGLGIRWDLPCGPDQPTPAVFAFGISLKHPPRFTVPINGCCYVSMWPLGALRVRFSFKPWLIRWRT